MIFMIIYLFCVIAAVGLGALAGWNDFKGMTIPNYIVALVLAAFFIGFGAVYIAKIDDVFYPFASHMIAGGVIFAITYAMYLMKKIGGGDSKLATAFAFWFGMHGMIPYLFYMAFSGAILGGAALVIKKKKPFKAPAEGSWLARVQAGEGVVPYGIPIAIGAIGAFLRLGFLSPDTLQLFLVPN